MQKMGADAVKTMHCIMCEKQTQMRVQEPKKEMKSNGKCVEGPDWERQCWPMAEKSFKIYINLMNENVLA